MKNNIAVEINNLTKEFVLPHQREKTIKGFFVNKFRSSYSEKMLAINNLSLTVKKGGFLGIIGPNGAGKSTLLKIISGIYLPTSGKVSVNGTLSPLLELMVGFQGELTARDNVYLYGALLGLTRNEVNKKYKKIVRFAELEKFMDQRYKNISSGMKMRLGFAITSHVESDILLVDEALAVGDEYFQQKCITKMNDLNKNGITIVFVSHRLKLIEHNCKRALVLHDGKIADNGNPKIVIKKYLKTKNV